MIAKYSNISRANVAKSLRWFSRQNNALKLEIFKSQKQYFYKLKNIIEHEVDLTLLTAAAFEIACFEIYQLTLAQNKKNKILTLKGVKPITKLRAKQVKQPNLAAKWEKLLNLKNVVTQLIEQESFSYRQVSTYLLRVHKFKVSHTLISKFYKNTTKGDENV